MRRESGSVDKGTGIIVNSQRDTCGGCCNANMKSHTWRHQGCELIAARADRPSFALTSEQVRERMAATPGLECFAETELPTEGTVHVESDMQLVDL